MADQRPDSETFQAILEETHKSRSRLSELEIKIQIALKQFKLVAKGRPLSVVETHRYRELQNARHWVLEAMGDLSIETAEQLDSNPTPRVEDLVSRLRAINAKLGSMTAFVAHGDYKPPRSG